MMVIQVRKGKGGFYRINKDGEKKILEAINLKTGKYFKSKKINLNFDDNILIKSLITRKDKYGEYAWSVLSKVILYASSLIPDVTDEHNNIDEAMRLGFNWTIGPFEMLDEIGVKFFSEKDQNLKLNRFINELYLPSAVWKEKRFWYGKTQVYLNSNLKTLRRIKRKDHKQLKNIGVDYRIFDRTYPFTRPYGARLGEFSVNYPNKLGVRRFNIVEFITKANTLDRSSMEILHQSTDEALIIINDAIQFSSGVNLKYVMNFANEGNWREIEKFIYAFQQTCKTLKYSSNPVISAPSGLAIGGGFEVVVQSDYVVSHTNVVFGLVETLVGLIPAGGGCKEMLLRWMQTEEAKKDPNFASLKVFDIIGYAKTANSPNEAIPYKFLLGKDKVVINRDKLLDESEKLLEEIREDYKPSEKPVFNLPGSSVRDRMYEILENLYKEKKILDHGMEVGKQLAFVLSGGNTTLDRELRRR